MAVLDMLASTSRISGYQGWSADLTLWAAGTPDIPAVAISDPSTISPNSIINVMKTRKTQLFLDIMPTSPLPGGFTRLDIILQGAKQDGTSFVSETADATAAGVTTTTVRTRQISSAELTTALGLGVGVRIPIPDEWDAIRVRAAAVGAALPCKLDVVGEVLG